MVHAVQSNIKTVEDPKKFEKFVLIVDRVAENIAHIQ